MAKDKSEPELDDENDDADGDAPKGRFSKKFLMIAGGGAAAVVLLLGAGIYFFFFSGPSDADKPKMVGNVVLPVVPPQVAFYDMPDLVVNIQCADPTPAYLKLSVSLELDDAGRKARHPGADAAHRRPVPELSARTAARRSQGFGRRAAREGRTAAPRQCRRPRPITCATCSSKK